MSFLGFGFSGYRSIGDELVVIAPLKKINLIIGQNNSGKSNIINFLAKGLPEIVNRISRQSNSNYKFENIDKHISTEPVKCRVAFPAHIDKSYFDENISPKIQNSHYINANKAYELWLKILRSDVFEKNGNYALFNYDSTDLNSVYNFSHGIECLVSVLNIYEWENFWEGLCKEQNKNIGANSNSAKLNIYISDVIKNITPSLYIPHVELIPAIRKIGDVDTSADDYSGSGIINRLAELQNPTLEKQHNKQKFEAINNFLRTVLENEKATLDIPHTREYILVHMDNKTLPLSSLGTGIHEVVILAAAATLLEESILCVEEPELHLHPLLQRKLIKYLSENTSNQYIFTTHSAHLLDTEDAQIFHVRNINGKTIVDSVSSNKEKSSICHDLGYKASDILQANCIIWVEGPSDRIYLKFWLESIDKTLVEGIHYSIMFFGGRLFSHITGHDKEDIKEDDEHKLTDFISVRKLNRNSCIFFDSDKISARDKINDTKKRLEKEFNEGHGFAWITAGRETENYINPEHIEDCVKQVHPSALELISKDKWANTLKYKKISNTKKKESESPTANKVNVAKKYIETYQADLSIYDLQDKIKKLREFIYTSNNLKMSNS